MKLREIDVEASAFAHFTFHLNRALVQFDKGFHHGKSNARASLVVVALEETLENV